MIPISEQAAIYIYVSLIFTVFLALFIYEEIRSREMHRPLSKTRLYFCAECNNHFIVRRGKRLKGCPNCGTKSKTVFVR